jgi:hypothetical protein
VEGTAAPAADAVLAGQEALLPMIWQQLPGGRMVPVPLQSPVRAVLSPASACGRLPCMRGNPSIRHTIVLCAITSLLIMVSASVTGSVFLHAGRRAAVFHGQPANRRRAIRRCHAARADALDAVCQPVSGEIGVCST